jgi:molecular chaperone DnaK
MNYYIGIDLGTTNSAICSYDGNELRTHLSSEQNRVTPSAIYIDTRSRYYGSRAYEQVALRPGNTASGFKRLMGTATPICVPAMNLTLQPEECSSEILKFLYGYLPFDWHPSIQGTVVTVPAAFNQMQKDATMTAASAAGIGKVALMQEPVAAILSSMRVDASDAVFLVYDLGGGTFDIALADSHGSQVSIREHGGIATNGGRDWDRRIVDTLVMPWLLDTFDLPSDFESQAAFRKFRRLLEWGAEKAKIGLSQTGANQNIVINEDEMRLTDAAGRDMYVDVTLTAASLDRLIEPLLHDTLQATRALLDHSGFQSTHIDRIVFIGGPTQYQPLRDKICSELGITGDTRVDPMTAVAEGAAIFAESLAWDSELRDRKSSRSSISVDSVHNIRFDFIGRTPKDTALLKLGCSSTQPGATFQIDNIDTGTSYGRMPLTNGASVNLVLPRQGEHRFKCFLFGENGQPLAMQDDLLVITRTAASIDAIPASHSIGIEIKEGLASKTTRLQTIVEKGDRLPVRRQKLLFRAGDSIKAGSDQCLYFNLYQGEIESPVSDNECIGCLKISGKDFDYGVIQPGDELFCDFTMNDAGHITLAVSAPAVTGRFQGEFYSRQEAQLDYSQPDTQSQIETKIEATLDRVNTLASKINDPRLKEARSKLLEAGRCLENQGDGEEARYAMDRTQEAKQLLDVVRKANLATVRQLDLDQIIQYFENIKNLVQQNELTDFTRLLSTSRRAIVQGDARFDDYKSELWSIISTALWRQDWYVTERFTNLSRQSHLCRDKAAFDSLVSQGQQAIRANRIDTLRSITNRLWELQPSETIEEPLTGNANIMGG